MNVKGQVVVGDYLDKALEMIALGRATVDEALGFLLDKDPRNFLRHASFYKMKLMNLSRQLNVTGLRAQDLSPYDLADFCGVPYRLGRFLHLIIRNRRSSTNEGYFENLVGVPIGGALIVGTSGAAKSMYLKTFFRKEIAEQSVMWVKGPKQLLGVENNPQIKLLVLDDFVLPETGAFTWTPSIISSLFDTNEDRSVRFGTNAWAVIPRKVMIIIVGNVYRLPDFLLGTREIYVKKNKLGRTDLKHNQLTFEAERVENAMPVGEKQWTEDCRMIPQDLRRRITVVDMRHYVGDMLTKTALTRITGEASASGFDRDQLWDREEKIETLSEEYGLEALKDVKERIKRLGYDISGPLELIKLANLYRIGRKEFIESRLRQDEPTIPDEICYKRPHPSVWETFDDR